jgi:hypothetical protein
MSDEDVKVVDTGAGKGDDPRPTDIETYDNNYDEIDWSK